MAVDNVNTDVGRCFDALLRQFDVVSGEFVILGDVIEGNEDIADDHAEVARDGDEPLEVGRRHLSGFEVQPTPLDRPVADAGKLPADILRRPLLESLAGKKTNLEIVDRSQSPSFHFTTSGTK